MTTFDFIVVGSGATGSMVAQTLAEDGATVAMLDAGQRDETYASLIPPTTFDTLRRTDEAQWRYLLGDHFESISQSAVAPGAQLTPPRRFVVSEVDRFLDVRSSEFAPLESLAFGGLGSAWGLGCCVFSERELRMTGLPVGVMRSAYQVVADRIGISGADDDARPYTFAHLDGVQPAVPLDPTAALLYEGCQRHREEMRRVGLHAGRPALALLTQGRGDRGPASLRDMEFYSDADRAAWRPWMTVESLRDDRFSYMGDLFVTHLEEEGESVCVSALHIPTLQRRSFRGKFIVLASGTLGTARIVLRSLGGSGTRLPILCNPYTYIPCVIPRRFGKAVPKNNMSLAQLMLFHDPSGSGDDVGMVSIYSYRALMAFRLLREAPLDAGNGIPIVQYLMSGLIIAGVHHPETRSADRFIRLEPWDGSPTRDRLCVVYRHGETELAAISNREKLYMRALRSAGAFPIKRVRPANGASIHYAGTLPFSDGAVPFTLSRSGLLHGTRRVYVADGSGFRYLPAKSLTLSLMANAHLVASNLLRNAGA